MYVKYSTVVQQSVCTKGFPPKRRRVHTHVQCLTPLYGVFGSKKVGSGFPEGPEVLKCGRFAALSECKNMAVLKTPFFFFSEVWGYVKSGVLDPPLKLL